MRANIAGVSMSKLVELREFGEVWQRICMHEAKHK